MTAITADEYYKANIGREKEYVRVGYAYPVKAGDTLRDLKKAPLGTCGIRNTIIATEDGYVVVTYPNKEFLTCAEFEEKKVLAVQLKLPNARKPLSNEEAASMGPLRNGEVVKYTTEDGKAAEWIPDNYFVHTKHDGEDRYTANHELAVFFNIASAKVPGPKFLVVTDKEPSIEKGIVVDKEVTFNDGGQEFKATPGFFLFYDPALPGECIITSPGYLNLNLRLPKQKPNKSKGPAIKASPK